MVFNEQMTGQSVDEYWLCELLNYWYQDVNKANNILGMSLRMEPSLYYKHGDWMAVFCKSNFISNLATLISFF